VRLVARLFMWVGRNRGWLRGRGGSRRSPDYSWRKSQNDLESLPTSWL